MNTTRIYTLADVAEHDEWNDCWVVHDNKVYDVRPAGARPELGGGHTELISPGAQVSRFLHDHPGGDDLIRAHAGKDVTAVMTDPLEHAHTKAAYGMLREFQIGVIGASEHLLDPNYVYSEEVEPSQTQTEEDYQRNHFIDLRQPLLMQVLRSNYSKSFYLDQ